MASNNNRIRFGIDFQVNKSGIEEVKKSLQSLQKLKIGDVTGGVDSLRKISEEAAKVESALTKAFNVKLNSVNVDTFNKELQRTGTSVEKVYQAFSKAGTAGKTAFSQMATSVLTTNLQLKQTHSLLQQMGTTMMNTVKWGIASSVMNTFTNSVQQAFQYVTSLDSALTDIRIVTGDSAEKMADFAVQANRAAQELGRSTMEYTKSALTFYQQGLNDEQVAARNEAVMKAQNITGAGSEMADYLTAVWNGYKVANQEAELYVDKLAAVADSSASNMSQLAIAMSKVAAAANQLGVPVDSLNAQIATIVATTRDAPESVGNALKTIYSRINDISTGAQDAQISLGNYSEKMLEVGISVLDANGRLRDTGDVIEQIGGKWDTLSKEQQIYLARTMAGQRQYTRLVSLFDNWDKYIQLVNTSLNSQGATMEKNSRYMESLQAHMNQLGAAGERVKSAMINSDSFKGLIDFGTQVTTVFANFIESIGGGGNALLMLGSIVGNVFGNIIARQINGFITNMKAADYNVKQLQADIQLTKDFGKIEGLSENAVKDVVKYKQAIQQYYSTMSAEQINTYNNLVKTVGQLETEYEEKKKIADITESIARKEEVGKTYKVGDNTFSSSFAEYQEYVSKIKTQIEEVSVKNQDAQSSFKTLLQKTNQFKYELGDIDFKKLGGEELQLLQQKFDKAREKGQPLGSIVRQIKDKLLQMANAIQEIDPEKAAQLRVQAEALKGRINQAKDAVTNFIQQTKQMSEVKAFVNVATGIAGVASAINSVINLTKIWNDKNKSVGEKLLQTFMAVGQAAGMLSMNFSKLITSLAQLAIKFSDSAAQAAKDASAKIANAAASEAGAAGNSVLSTSFAALGGAIHAALPELLIIAGIIAAITVTAYALAQAWNHDAKVAEQAAENVEKAKKAYEEAKQAVEDLHSAFDNYQLARDAVDEMIQGTKQWRDAIKEANIAVLQLIHNYPELAKEVANVNGQLIISQEGIDTYFQKLQQEANKALVQQGNAEQISRKADITSQATNIGREVMADLGRFTTFGDNAIDSTEVINAAQALSSAIENGEENISSSNEKLVNQIMTASGVTQQQAVGLINNSEKLLQLKAAMDANTAATVLQSQNAVQPELEKNENYQNLDVLDQSVVTALAAGQYQLDIQQAQGLPTAQQLINTFALAGTSLSEADAELIIRTIAAAQALQNMESTTNSAIQALNNINNSDLSDTQKQGIKNLLTNQDFNKDFTESQLKQLQDIDWYEVFNEQQLQQMANALGVDVDTMISNYDRGVTEVLSGFDKVLQGTSKSVQNAFNKLNTGDMSLSIQQQIVEDLQHAFNEGGIEAMQGVADFYDQLSDTSKLEEALTGINWEEITPDELQVALQDAGAATDVTTQALQAYINAQKEAAEVTTPQEAYKSVNDIISKLKDGDSIDSDQAEILEKNGIDLTNYFDRLADGTLKLKVKAEEFFKYANSVNLNNFKQRLDQAQQTLNSLQAFQSSDYSASSGKTDFEDFSTSANTYIHPTGAPGDVKIIDSTDQDKVNAQVEFLNGLLTTTNNLTQDQKQLVQEINSGEADVVDKADEIAKAVSNHQNEWQKNTDRIKEQEEQVSRLSQELTNSSKIVRQLDPDVDEDKWKNLADYLEKYADQLEDVSDDVQGNRQVAEDLAEEMLRYASALEQVNEKYDDWQTALTSGSLEDQIQAGNELQNVYNDLLGLPFDNLLSPAFTQSTKNLDLLKQAAQGSEEAYNRLLELAGQDLGAQFGIDPETFQSQLDAVRNLVQNFTHQDWDDIEVGAKLNDEGFLQGLTNMVNAAGMGAEEAANYLGSMGIDAEIETVNQPTEEVKQTDGGYITDLIPTDAEETVMVMRGSGTPIPTQVKIPIRRYSAIVRPQPGSTETVKSDNVGTALKVTSATKSSGGGFKFKNSTKPATKSSGGGGGKGGGGGGSPKQAKTEKHTTSKTKEKFVNPYEAIQRSYDRQEKVLKKLNSLESKLTGKDRLVNLQRQVRALQAQNDIIRERAALSKKNIEGTTAWYKNQLAGDEVLKDVLTFDPDKHINVTQLKNAAVDAYNSASQAAADSYNNWLDTVWNTLSGDEQQARKAEKEAWDQQLKDAQDAAQEEYKTRTEYIDAYEKALEDDIKNHEQYVENLSQILEHEISQITINVELAVDEGDLRRSLIEFRDVWDQWIEPKDPTKPIRTGLDELKASIKTNKKQFSSYWASGEVQKTRDAISDIQSKMLALQKTGATSYSSVYGDLGISREQWKELTDEEKADLRSQAYNALREQLKEQTENLQDLVKNMAEAVQQSYDNYLDAIDAAKDSMDDLIDQHERVNSLLEHDIALVQMLYGDKAYEAMDKYYNAQYKNDKAQLTQLMSQRAYWEKQLERATNEGLTGTEEWKKIKENLDSVIDATNSKVEEVIELLGQRLENRLNQAVQNVNLKLTGGLGLDYVSEEWDFINDFDDYFLDNVQSKMGIEDVTRAYEQAAADAYGNPKQVQRINSLMNDQLAILKEKDNLTQYDLDRAKSMLEVEQARFALEEARDNKTKMRLRRDSQGNYTYQYVADEKKLSDLQQALADAQNNLYNQDKQHYKENLNQLRDTYQEYLEGMRELTQQYNATQDEEEKARIAKRIQLYKQNYAKMYDALSQDNQVTHDQYLRQSVIEALGVDATTLTMQQQLDLVNNNVPQAQSAVQNMVNTIIGQGGLLPATSSMLKEFNKATSEYTASIESVLGKVKVNLGDIKNATDVTVQAAQALTSEYKDMEKRAKNMVKYAKSEYEELKNFVNSPEFKELRDYVEKAAKVYNTGNVTAVTVNNKSGTGSGSSSASSSTGKSKGSSSNSGSSSSNNSSSSGSSGSGISSNYNINGTNSSKTKTSQDLAKDYQNYLTGMKELTQQYNNAQTEKEKQKVQKKIKELENTVSSESLRAYVDALNSQALGLQDGLKATQAGIKNSVASIINEGTLNQNVTISASFPNVNSSRQIEDAFNNIINQAAQYIGKKKK